ncbi:hypothetical protein WG902_09605 [Ramlibacter sp. PS3R-8]|uniref:hypothetical protein n=1 Tax=Ramlibacter sp. PS3R-8 TaxID=3133437 RepID=UPI0030A5A98C
MPLHTALALLFLALPLAAQALCTSDGVAAPAGVLERFINADCAGCWQDPATATPASADTLVLDWVVPGSMGDDAPLSAVASNDAIERLRMLGRRVPVRSETVPLRRHGAGMALRLAQGAAFNDYVAASIELTSPGRSPWGAWLLLVEKLPAGTDGSPVARNLVRNVFRPDWGQVQGGTPGRLAETRALQIHEGARPERLRLVALLQDARGRIRAISQTECSE